MRRDPAAFLRDEDASTAAEFALVSLLFIAMTLSVIDMARLAYELSAAKAAARRGARVAAVSAPVVAQIADFDALSLPTPIPGGQPVPEGTAGTGPFTCKSTGCTGGGTFVAANFTRVVNAMRAYYGRIGPTNVEISYKHRGLGTSGFIGSDIEPIITVRVVNLTFQPVTLKVFGVSSVPIPSVATTLTSESLGATSAII